MNKLIRTIKYLSFVGVLTIIIIELMLRMVTTFIGEPAKSIITEAKRISYSNTRSYGTITGGGVAIKLPDTLDADIVSVGDSFTAGTYVKSADTFSSKLAEYTNKKVVNLGIGSKGPPTYNRMLEVGTRYKPEIVLYAMFANDFLYNNQNSKNEKNIILSRSLSTNNCYKTQKLDHEWFKHKLSYIDIVNNLRKKFTNLFITFQIYKLIKQPSQKLEHITYVFKNNYFAFAGKKYWDDIISFDNKDVKEGLNINLKLIEQAYNFTVNSGIKLVVILIPTKEMVYGEILKDTNVIDKIYAKSHRSTYDYFMSKLKEMDIPYLNLIENLKKHSIKGDKLYFSIDGHFNELGHDIAAKTINTFLDEKID